MAMATNLFCLPAMLRFTNAYYFVFSVLVIKAYLVQAYIEVLNCGSQHLSFFWLINAEL